MNQAVAIQTYPTLMAYILDRNAFDQDRRGWYDQLNADKAYAETGGLAGVAGDMDRAQADYAAQEALQGRDGYPYNAAVGTFLGLPLSPGNHEPACGYYMAGQVQTYYKLGSARREVIALIAEGKPLQIVTARSKTDRKPVRFLTFAGAGQILIEGNGVKVTNGKKGFRLSSNWSAETCLMRVADALRTGHAYGEAA